MIVSIKSICISEREDKFEDYYKLWKSYINFPKTLSFDRLLTVDEIIRTNSIIIGKYSGLRKVNVYPFGYDLDQYSSFENIENELYGLVDLFNKISIELVEVEDILSSFSFLYKKFLKIHPFIDGNGRTIKVIISKFYMYEFNSCLIWKYLDHDKINDLLNRYYIFDEFFDMI